MQPSRERRLRVRSGMVMAAAVTALLAIPTFSQAHIERPGYWPDPARDKSVDPPAGGRVPKARSLGSALDQDGVGHTRVVCKQNSLSLLKKSVERAHKHGYEIRPHDQRSLSASKAHRLLEINRRLAELCEYHQIQPAVNDSGNNDRVVIMPGLYTESHSRDQPTNDPACDKFEGGGDHPDQTTGAVSYAYQFHCPNDQNLIAVMGRRPGKASPPNPPRWDRRGIPDLGRCIRCNFQIEGSGVSADDVVIEAGDRHAGNGGPAGAGAAKEIGIRADRADGFVLRNLTVRHAEEHGIYVLESDGYLVDRFKVFYNGFYGVLTFVEDHGLMENCEGVGHGDSALYPGAAADTGEQRAEGTRFRYNQEIRRCDLHHNATGYSGTDGNAVHVDRNNFYDNTLGLTTDSATGAGHPGFPQDSSLIEDNDFYSNNLNLFERGSDIVIAAPYPVGTGMWIPGGNNDVVRDNRFWDNWRRGTMLFAIPDALVCGPGNNGNEQAGCDSSRTSTSNRNSHYGNVMGIAPGGQEMPNGLDFWWDSFPGNKANCWYDNTGSGPITSEPPAPLLPNCNDGKDPDSSVGTGDLLAESEIASCIPVFLTYNFQGPESSSCPWFKTPPRPGSSAARRAQGADVPARPPESFFDFCDRLRSSLTCLPFAPLRGGRDARRLHQTTRQAPQHDPSTQALQLFTCANWEQADQATRLRVIRGLRSVNGGQVTGNGVSGRGKVLSDEGAYRLFENYCAQPFARGFLLYKLYGRTAAFAPAAP